MPKPFKRWRGDLDVIEFKIAGREYRIDPNEELAIDETLVPSELARSAAKQAWIGVVVSMAERLEGRREFERDTCKAKLDPEVRRGANKKLTEAAVKAAVQRHPSFAKATEAHLQAKELAGKLRALERAFKTRDFDLRELSARQRGERAGSRG